MKRTVVMRSSNLVKRFSLMIVSLLSFFNTAYADNLDGGIDPTLLPAPLQALLDHTAGDQVIKKFSVTQGVDGWVITKGGQEIVLYTLSEHKLVMAGSLYNTDGDDLTVKYLKEHTSRFDVSPAQEGKINGAQAREALAQTWYLLLDKPSTDLILAKQRIYVFVDLQCPYSHLLWDIMKYADQSLIEITWVPVSFLGQISLQKSALLAAESRSFQSALGPNRIATGALQEYMRVHVSSNELGPTPVVGDDVLKIAVNNQVLTRLGGSGVPVIMWIDKEDRFHHVQGLTAVEDLRERVGLSLKTLPQSLQERLDAVLAGSSRGSIQ